MLFVNEHEPVEKDRVGQNGEVESSAQIMHRYASSDPAMIDNPESDSALVSTTNLDSRFFEFKV